MMKTTYAGGTVPHQSHAGSRCGVPPRGTRRQPDCAATGEEWRDSQVNQFRGSGLQVHSAVETRRSGSNPGLQHSNSADGGPDTPRPVRTGAADRPQNRPVEFIAERRLLLESLREQLRRHLENSRSGGDDERLKDPVDEQARKHRLDVDASVWHANRRLLRSVERALGALDAGEYGVCEDCGGEIGDRRLLASPWATLCIDCASERERTA